MQTNDSIYIGRSRRFPLTRMSLDLSNLSWFSSHTLTYVVCGCTWYNAYTYRTRKCGNWRCIATEGRPARCYCWLKIVLGARDTSDLMSFTLTMRRHLIRFATAPFRPTSSRLTKSGWVPFAVCNAWQRSRTENLRRAGENSGPIFTRLWTKVYEIFRRCRRCFVLSNVLDRLSMSRTFQKIFAIKSRSRLKTEQM